MWQCRAFPPADGRVASPVDLGSKSNIEETLRMKTPCSTTYRKEFFSVTDFKGYTYYLYSKGLLRDNIMLTTGIGIQSWCPHQSQKLVNFVRFQTYTPSSNCTRSDRCQLDVGRVDVEPAGQNDGKRNKLLCIFQKTLYVPHTPQDANVVANANLGHVHLRSKSKRTRSLASWKMMTGMMTGGK